jgi:hypothetical protein
MKVKKILTLVVVSLFSVGLLVVSASAVNLDTTINDYGNIIDVSGYTLLTNIDTSNVSFEYVSGYKIIVAEFSEVGDCYAVKRGTQTDTVYEVGSFGFSRFDNSSPYKFVCWEVGNPYSSYEIDGFDIYVKNYPFTVSNPTIWNQVGFVTYNIGNGTVDPDNPVDPEDPEDPVIPDNPNDPEDPEDPVIPDNPNDPDLPDIPHITVPYGSAVKWFEDMMDDRSRNYAYGLLMSLYNGYGDSRFFKVPTLVSGVTDIRYSPTYTANVSLWSSVVPDGEYASSQIHGTIDVDAFSYALYTNYGMPVYYDYYQKGKIEISMYFETGQNARVTLKFYPDNANTYTVMLEYNGTFSSNSVSVILDTITTFDGNYTPDQLSKMDFVFTVTEGTTPNLLSVLCELLFIRDVCTYDDVIYSPRDFYYGLDLVYNLGYEDGYRISYPIAREEGFTDGYKDGETVGYEKGYSKGKEDGLLEHPDVSKAYNDGYNKAVSEIDSGEYGQNLLGNVFSAPLNAVQSIVLVTLPDGYAVTLGHILSAIFALMLVLVFVKIYSR